MRQADGQVGGEAGEFRMNVLGNRVIQVGAGQRLRHPRTLSKSPGHFAGAIAAIGSPTAAARSAAAWLTSKRASR